MVYYFADLCQECLVQGGIGYNSYPPDCTKYVTCYPQETGGYRTEVKDCPFGLFWSSQAVACVDAAYVNCSAGERSHSVLPRLKNCVENSSLQTFQQTFSEFCPLLSDK